MSGKPTTEEGAEASAPETEKTTEEQIWGDLSEAEGDLKEAQDDEGDGEDDGDDNPPEGFTSEDDTDDEADEEEAPVGVNPEALKEQNDRLQHAYSSNKGRLAASQREIEKLKHQIATARQAQSSGPNEATLKASREKIAASQAEYGDVVGPLADHIKSLEDRFDTLKARDAIDLQNHQDRYGELIAQENAVFTTEHPDGFKTIIDNRKAFDGWVEDQPRAIRDIYAANKQEIVDGAKAAYLVAQFKASLSGSAGSNSTASTSNRNKLDNRRQAQLAGARSVRGGTTSQAATSRPSKDSPDASAHWDYFSRQDDKEKRRR